MATCTDDLTLIMALRIRIYRLTSAGSFHIVNAVSLFAITESLAARVAVDANAIAWLQFVWSPDANGVDFVERMQMQVATS